MVGLGSDQGEKWPKPEEKWPKPERERDLVKRHKRHKRHKPAEAG